MTIFCSAASRTFFSQATWLQKAPKPTIFLQKSNEIGKLAYRKAVSEVSVQLNKIRTRKPEPDGTKVKNGIFAKLAVAFLQIWR